MEWETGIGLETHAQLSTASKIFSGAATQFGAAPNVQACAVDIALPGVLPVLNRAAVEKAVRFGLPVGATINRRSVFERKNYFYPDLPKGYQISQYELPVVQGGSLSMVVKDGEKTVRLTRAHLEEDAGKSLHEDFHGMSGIDLNRAGTPLLEIVTEPDMRSAEEAVAYAKALHALVRWIGICDGNMQEGVVPLRRQCLGALQRLGGARHALRDQEPQFVPLSGRGHQLRSAPPDRIARRGWDGSAGNPPLRSGQKRNALDALERGCARLPLFSGPRPAASGHKRRIDRADSIRIARIAAGEARALPAEFRLAKRIRRVTYAIHRGSRLF